MNYNYFASPYNSPRAMSFRERYGNASPGQDFWFEGQPYAGPPAPPPSAPNFPGGLYDEEGSGTATGYRPIERMNPNDQAYMSPEMLAAIAEKEASRMRFGERIGGRSKVLRDRPVWDHFEKRWVEPEGSFVQSPHGLDALEQDSINARYASVPYNPPRFAAANQMGVAQIQHNPPSSVTGMYGPGQDTGLTSGLLSGPMVNRTQSGLLADNSNTNQYTDKSGWEKDRKFARAGEMLMLFGGDYMREDPFGDGR